MKLQAPVTSLKGVGGKRAAQLEKLGIKKVLDVLFHLPLRYQDRTRISPVGSLRPGDHALVDVTIDQAAVRFGRRRSLLVHVSDGTGSLMLRFFHFSQAQQKRLTGGSRLRCFGEVRNGPAGFELVHPEYQFLSDGELPAVDEVLTPVYPTTEGVHQLTWRGLTDQALSILQDEDLITDPLGRYLDKGMPALTDALRLVHRPPADVALNLLLSGQHPAQQRLAFEELLAHQISLRQLRHKQMHHQAPILIKGDEAKKRLQQSLPFELTRAQNRVVDEIAQGMSKGSPMLRLVQGDVGSGKTVVAALAALQAIDSGYQVALMAPTELLAEQHLQSMLSWLSPMAIRVESLSGRQTASQRKAILSAIESGEIQLAVGTHALFQNDVIFDQLGLVIIDEQHRFGVHQRLALREKGQKNGLIPHQLIMTATPIPRSLAMTAYADLDLSIIDELPPGRKPVTTVVMSDQRRDEVLERVRQACESGRQAYWVCTLIEDSEVLQCQAAEETERLLSEQLPSLSVGLVHGRMKPADKEVVMSGFKSGALDLLVATTVIEVGVDVPNASLMIIENPERLGLAQLHQLRGRVGRGTESSYCVLMYKPPLGGQAMQRLGVMRETNDGFRISEKDLEIRGPGEVLGTRQTGEMRFRIADLMRDEHLIASVRRVADQLITDDEDFSRQLVQRWLGDISHYGGV